MEKNDQWPCKLTLKLGKDPECRELWVAVVPELYVVSQGDSPEHAYTNALRAAVLLINDDLEHGRDPLERGSAYPGDDQIAVLWN